MTRARATLEMLLADVEASLAHNRARWEEALEALRTEATASVLP
jgi:hypothetical protein